MSVPETKIKQNVQSFWQVKRLVLMALFIALSVIGAMLKIPSPTGTVALDSAPGFLGAALLGWKEGLVIAALGHLASAYSAGFPLSLPIHLLVALQMAVAVSLFALLLHKTNGVIAVAAAVFINGVLMPLSLVPILGPGIFYGMVLPLTVAALVNTVLAYVLYRALGNMV
ncbi:MAG TPA: ECF transporter S component [Clostridia bacterium]|nr:ECF transporter S component [Clostridia bacterium]